MSNAIKQAALLYLNNNLSVIPTNQNKLPALKWDQYKTSPISQTEINKHFGEYNSIAIICGKVSGGLEIIDIDCKYDLTGRLFPEYTNLVKELGGEPILKKLVIEKTPTGGWHLIYKCSTIEGNQKLANRETTELEKEKNPKEKVKVLIETRGEGGYFVSAPSSGYVLKQLDFTSIPVITPGERSILLDAARAFDEYYPDPYPQEKEPDNTPGISPFDDYNNRGDCVALLQEHGWTVVKDNPTKVTLKRPGDSATKYSAYFHKDKNWFTVFSTSTEFQNQKAYLPYAVFAILECNGDFKAAYKKLLNLGYGTNQNSKDKNNSQEEKQQEAKEKTPLTIGMSMNEALKTAQSMPKMKRMFATLLLENTLNIWGGDNGVGKSILAFSLAEHLARGWNFLGFENESEALKIILYDFELTLQGLLKRYSNKELRNPYQFSPNLYRFDFNPDFCDFSKNYDDQLFEDIRQNVIKLGAKVLIIDNLTALKSKSNSDGDIALDLMNRLNRLKKELSITIIVLTHITKHPTGLPIEKNHIAGSKHLQNLCDSIVAVGASCQGNDQIYIKELKNRYEQQQYGPDNIIVCERVKKDNFLTIEFTGFDIENNHLGNEIERSNDDPKAQAIKLRKEGKTIGEIATELKKSKSTIHVWTAGVRSFENPSESERTNGQNTAIDEVLTDILNQSACVRSTNEQPNGYFEKVKLLAKQVLGEYESREKSKVIQAIKAVREVDILQAEALFNSMIEYDLIQELESGYYYLSESVPY